MNYQKIYNQIIDRARKENREKGVGIYYEAHHTIPKCLGGEGEVSQWKVHPNISILTAREHFLVHRLLTRIYPESNKLVFAFWAMCNRKSKGQEERYVPSSRVYEEARKLFSESNSVEKKAFWQTEKGKEIKKQVGVKLSIAKTAFYQTERGEETKKQVGAKQSATKIILYQTERGRAVIEKRVNNTDWEARALKFNKMTLQFTKDNIFIREWSSVKEAGEVLGINKHSIANCCRGVNKSSGGFIWKYK